MTEAVRLRALEWVLRIALFGEFLGHGIFALQVHPPFVDLLTGATGLPVSAAPTLLRIIGSIDVLIAILALVKPLRPILAYAALWGLLTGLSRPAAGKPVLDFVERWANWGIPAALFLVRTPSRESNLGAARKEPAD